MKKTTNLKKEIKIYTSPIITTRSRNSETEEDEETKEPPKESYSTFLIRMLVGENNQNKKLREKMTKTIYKSNIQKNKINYNPFNTNYSKNIKKVTFSKGNNQNNNEINKINSLDKSSIKKIISFTARDNLIRKKGNLLTKNIKSSNPTQSNNQNKNNLKKFKSFDLKNDASNIKLIRNVQEILEDSNFLTKSTNFKNSKNKKVKMIRSVNNLNKKRLNALYGYDQNFIKSKKFLLKKKDLIGLENYQNDILKVSKKNLCKDNLFKLFTELQSIKKNADLVKPLPPIDYPALIVHSFKEVEDRKRHIQKKSLEDKNYKDMDDYEKELYKIRKSNAFKRVKVERNKRMYKIYEILPEHVVDALYKNKNKVIK